MVAARHSVSTGPSSVTIGQRLLIVVALTGSLASAAAAQTAGQGSAQTGNPAPSSQLPAVVVQTAPAGPAAKPAKHKAKGTAKTASKPIAPVAASSQPASETAPAALPETAISPVKGFVAKVSGTAGTR